MLLDQKSTSRTYCNPINANVSNAIRIDSVEPLMWGWPAHCAISSSSPLISTSPSSLSSSLSSSSSSSSSSPSSLLSLSWSSCALVFRSILSSRLNSSTCPSLANNAVASASSVAAISAVTSSMATCSWSDGEVIVLPLCAWHLLLQEQFCVFRVKFCREIWLLLRK